MLRRRLAGVLTACLLVGGLIGTAVFVAGEGRNQRAEATSAIDPTSPVVGPTGVNVIPTTTTTVATTTTSPTTTMSLVPARVGEPSGTVAGLTMFRGNPSRTFYGTGPFPPTAPTELWRYPQDGPMCGMSTVAGETTQWCGTGWTGQPVVWERPDGVTEVVFGAYDKAVHFVDAETGRATRPPFQTGDIIKGSVTLDPNGFPLLYTGSRDNNLRIIALDRDEPTELWSLNADAVAGIWNDDWDSNPVIVDDMMFEGGENGWFFAIALNREIGDDGLVTVDPQVVFEMPGWTDELIDRVGRNVSIESSVAVFEDRAYFTNSGGRIVGLDISDVRSGNAPVVFDYWAGDDIDATPVVDSEGMLYVAIEAERGNDRSREVGQLVKLDPYTDGDPRVWGLDVPPVDGGAGGIWATPALGFGHVYVPTHTGRLLAVDAESGEITFEDTVTPHTWSSAVVVDDALLVAPCETAELRAYGLEDPAMPVMRWSLEPAAEGCIESTPAVWNGRIYVGSRDGYLRAYG